MINVYKNSTDEYTVSEITATTYSIRLDLTKARSSEINIYYNYIKGDESGVELKFQTIDPDIASITYYPATDTTSIVYTQHNIKTLNASNQLEDYEVNLIETGTGRFPVPVTQTEKELVILANFEAGSEAGKGALTMTYKEHTANLRRTDI